MIQLKNVSKVYQKNGTAVVRALDDVSLDINQGEFVAVVGPSGSGKSTLMNIIGLLDRPTKGDYSLDNREVSELGIDELAKMRNQKIGFVFQSFHLLPRTSALENVELPLIYSDDSQPGKPALEALKTVGLAHRARHFPGELSGGQQQRVAIARALVNNPEIIFADEPTGNLDTTSGLEVMSIFQQLNRGGKTIVLITHDPDLASHASRIIRIVDGGISTDERVTHPKDAAKELHKRGSAPRIKRGAAPRTEEYNEKK
ncbi:MAG: ABC transporter ATP-binding protein [bacterium]|nr:ABC transporter ATP-binding protein [bacterium]